MDYVEGAFSPDVFSRVEAEIYGALKAIERFPHIGKSSPSMPGVRFFTVMRKNVIFYETRSSEIVVLAIARSGQEVSIKRRHQ